MKMQRILDLLLLVIIIFPLIYSQVDFIEESEKEKIRSKETNKDLTIENSSDLSRGDNPNTVDLKSANNEQLEEGITKTGEFFGQRGNRNKGVYEDTSSA
ncbi:MAG: hypothetical protein ACXAEU_25220, partial [Candidatus Hodarchaeales archaeon]